MTCDEAKKLISEGPITIVDIRAIEDYKMGHIENAIWLSDDSIEKFLTESDKNVPVLCAIMGLAVRMLQLF